MNKVKIPKRVAGVKVPKKVRKQAKMALKAADSPVVQKFATAALAAATQARGSRILGEANGGDAARRFVGIDGERLVDAVRMAAVDGLRRFLEGFEEGMREAAAGDRAKDEPKMDGPQTEAPEQAAKPRPRVRPRSSPSAADADA